MESKCGRRDLLLSSHASSLSLNFSFLPHVGRVTIIMNDYPLVKYALIGVLGLFVVTSKE